MIKPFLKDPVDEGCRPALFAATSEDVVKEGIQGQYVRSPLHYTTQFFPTYLLCRFSEPILLIRCTQTLQIVPDRKITDPSKQAQDEELGENLWRLSEQIIEDKLGGLPYKEEM